MITIEKVTQQIQIKKPIKPIERKAAILVPIVTIDSELQLLFQVRSQNLKWQPGDICFPGGHIEPTDLTPEHAAIRESHEELGIPSNDITILGELPKFNATIGMIIYPFVGKIESLKQLNLNKNEVEHIFTVPIEWFRNNNPHKATMLVGHKPDDDFPFALLPNRPKEWQNRSKHTVYFYHYNQYTIWGLTAQIIKHFIDTIG